MFAEGTCWAREWSSPVSGSKEVSFISSLAAEETCLLLELVAERGRRFLVVYGTGNAGDVVRSIAPSCEVIVDGMSS